MAKSKKTTSDAPKAASPSQEEGFDARLDRLEGLVAELEGGDLGLEEAMERFSEGVRLLGICREALGAYEERVEELSAQAEAGLDDIRSGDPEE